MKASVVAPGFEPFIRVSETPNISNVQHHFQAIKMALGSRVSIAVKQNKT